MTKYKLIRKCFVEDEVQAIPRIAHILSARSQTKKFGEKGNEHYGTGLHISYLTEIEPKPKAKGAKA